MMRLSSVILALFVSFTSLFSQTYYVSSSDGSDNNNGLSESSPWKTIKRVNSKSFKPGDNILFKNGDIWIGEQLVIDHSGNASNKITYSTYDIGLKPIITLKEELPGWATSGNWTAVSDLINVYVMDLVSSREIFRLWLNNTEAKMAWDYKLQNYIPDGRVLYKGDNGDGTTGVCPEHQFYHDKSNNKFYLYSLGNPASYYSSIEYPGKISESTVLYETVSLRDADYVTIDGLDIQGSMNTSLGLSGSDYVTINNCDIGKNSNWTGVRGDYGRAVDRTSDHVTISNCTINSDWDYDYIFYNRATPYGISVQGIEDGGASYWNIYNNVIKNWWMNIYIISAVPTGVSQYHNIYNNDISSTCSFGKVAQISSGGSWGTPPTYVNFYNNYIHNIVFGIQISSSGNKFYYNIFNDMLLKSTNEHGGGGGWAAQMIGDVQDISPDSNYFFNNTYQNLIESAIIWEGNNTLHYNNLFINCGIKTSMKYSTRAGKNTKAQYINNLFHSTDSDTNSKLILLKDQAGYSISDWNLLDGQYNKVISNNIQHVGLIKDLINIADFTLPNGSLGLSSGASIEALVPEGFTDRLGNIVNRKNPNIGAIANSALEPTGFKVYLQGSYANGIMKTNLSVSELIPKSQPYNISPWNYSGEESVSAVRSEIVDWVLIELRSDTASASVAAKRAAFVRSDGNIVDLDGISRVSFNGINSGNYYVVIRHRNHLSIMSMYKVPLTGSFISYDFTTSRSSAFGNDLTDLKSGKFGMYAGDGDANGMINVLDYSNVGNALFQTGYLHGDYDLNGVVNVLDYSMTNRNLLKNSHVPGIVIF